MDAPPYFSTHGHLLVCVGPRCARAGSQRLYRDATSALEKRQLAYYTGEGTVRLTESGCLGACGHGPTLACYASRDGGRTLEAGWYHGADLPLVIDVAERVHRAQPLPSTRRYGP